MGYVRLSHRVTLRRQIGVTAAVCINFRYFASLDMYKSTYEVLSHIYIGLRVYRTLKNNFHLVTLHFPAPFLKNAVLPAEFAICFNLHFITVIHLRAARSPRMDLESLVHSQLGYLDCHGHWCSPGHRLLVVIYHC